MTNRMAYARGPLVALGLVVGLAACGDDIQVPDATSGPPPIDDGTRLSEIYVAIFGFDDEGGNGTRDFPLRTITRALELRSTSAIYGSADDIVLLTGRFNAGEETLPIRVPPGVTIRGGAGTIRASTWELGGFTEPLFRMASGSGLENMTIRFSSTAVDCNEELYHVLVDTGEAGFEQVTISDVVFIGGTPCHAQVGIGPRASVRIDGRSEFRLDGRAAAVRTLENTVDTTIEVEGDSSGNCTGVRVLEAGEQPTMFFRGDNDVTLRNLCFRPSTDEEPLDRTAIQIRGPINATFDRIEIDSSDGTENGVFFTNGIQHTPDAPLPTTAVTNVIDAQIESLNACIWVNGGTANITSSEGGTQAIKSFLTRCDFGILRTRGNLMVRNVDMSGHGESGVRLEGPAEGSIDLGTEASEGGNKFSNQTPGGRSGDLSIVLDELDPLDLTMVQAFGNTWTPVTVGEQVICRSEVQQEVFNIDSRQPGVDVTFNQGREDVPTVCPGYEPPEE